MSIEKPKKNPRVERFLKGTVISAKASKTVAVSVDRVFQHPLYKKIIRRRDKYLVHDEKGQCHPGDIIKMKLVRPISKKKRWIVVEVITAAAKEEVLHDTNAN